MRASGTAAAVALILGSSALLLFGACVKHPSTKVYIFPDMGPTNAALHRQQVERLEREIADGKWQQIGMAEIAYDIEPASVPRADRTRLLGRTVETYDILVSWWSVRSAPGSQAHQLRIVVQNPLWKPLHGVVFEIGGKSYCNALEAPRQISIRFAASLPVGANGYLDLPLVTATSAYKAPRRGNCARFVQTCEMMTGGMMCGTVVDAWIES